MSQTRILLTGAGGQIGTVLVAALRQRYGVENVLSTDVRLLYNDPNFASLDALDRDGLEQLVVEEKITQIYHLAAILSATGEQNPGRAWEINMNSWFSVLEVAHKHKLDRVFFPSSIAAFGVDTPSDPTPQFPYMAPTTVYGISKKSGELWGQYFFQKYGLDVRSLRYPGVIGHQSNPGGGTTDYAVDIFHYALRNEAYTSFLTENTRLPMIYMDDAVRATIELMEAPKEAITIRTSYNLSGFSCTPLELATAIQQRIPNFKVNYVADFRQQIADSWPKRIDDEHAQTDWKWKPTFTLENVVDDMLQHLRLKNEDSLANS